MFASQTRTGAPIAVSGGSLVPVARSARFSFGGIAIVWNRPMGVRVKSGSDEILVPIRDRTRRIQLAILLTGLIGGLILRRSRSRHGG